MTAGPHVDLDVCGPTDDRSPIIPDAVSSTVASTV